MSGVAVDVVAATFGSVSDATRGRSLWTKCAVSMSFVNVKPDGSPRTAT